MSRRAVWPFVTLVLGFALGALTVWALRDDTRWVAYDITSPDDVDLLLHPERRASQGGVSPDSKGAQPAQHDAADARGAARGAPRAGDARPGRVPVNVDPTRDGRGADAAGRADAGTPSNRSAAKPTGPSSAVAPAPPSAPLAVVVREAPGVVVDAATQQPIAGARVLLAVADGPRAGTWFGDTSDAEGRFAPRVGDDTDLRGARVELRVSKTGYEPSTTAVVGAEPVRVELRTRGAPPMPGRVAGVVARAEPGEPLPAEISVDGYDEHGGNASQFAAVDAQGGFVLEGVPPGRWRFARGGGNPVEVDVPNGGDARVELAPPRPAGQGGVVVTDVDPGAVKPADPARAARLAVLVELLQRLDPAVAPSLDDATRARLRLAVAQEVQRLDAEDRAALPRRAVTLTGLAARIEGGARAWVRLEPKPRLFWRVESRAGAAAFPAVPVGTYTAVLVQPGRPDQSCEVVVTPGEGAFTVEWK